MSVVVACDVQDRAAGAQCRVPAVVYDERGGGV